MLYLVVDYSLHRVYAQMEENVKSNLFSSVGRGGDERLFEGFGLSV